MPSKGKNKGGKGKEMTEEERQHILQQKALAEEEMQKKKEATITKFLIEKLQKEERSTRVNEYKLITKWRPVQRRARATELHEDITILSQTFERVLDHKDCIIKCLGDELNTAREQSARAHRSHLNCIERLLRAQSERLVALEQKWCTELEELCTDFNTEREVIMAQHRQECMYLEDVDFAMEQCHSEVDAETRQDFVSTCNEIKSRKMEEKDVLQEQLQGEAEVLWQQIQQAVQEYAAATKYRSRTYESLVARDNCSVLEIDSQMKKIQKLQHSITMLRIRLNSNQKRDKEEAQGLRSIREEVSVLARQINSQMTSNLARDRCHLASLVVYCNGASKKLQGIVDKGRKLLRLTELCHRLETDEEQSLRFYCHSPDSADSEENIPESCQGVERETKELAKAMLDYSGLESVWHRYNKVLLERLCLAKEQSALNQENEQLRAMLRWYLEGVSISDDVLHRPNTLLIISRPVKRQPETPQYHCISTRGQHTFMTISTLPSVHTMRHGH